MQPWQPPWPPIQVGAGEWIVMRDDKRMPAAVIRALRLGPRDELFYRAVSWAPTSEGRTLIGYYPTLDAADQAVLFSKKTAGPGVQPLHGYTPMHAAPKDGRADRG